MLRESFNLGWVIMDEKKSSLGLMMKHCKSKSVVLPHDGMIHEERRSDTVNQSQTGFYPENQYVYIKHFFVPEAWEEKTVMLEFEGVYQTAMVYINGHLAAQNIYGYSGFYATLDSMLKYGDENEIKVIADNSAAPNSRWYSGGGIYRNVNLLVANRIHIPADGVRITSRLGGKKLAVVDLDIIITNQTFKKHSVYVSTQISKNGLVVASEKTKVTLFPDSEEKVLQSICITNPILWSCETPELYDVKILVECKGEVLDETRERIGIRVLELNPVQGLVLNGESVKLRGACIHHDNGIIGAATFECAEERKIRLLKDAGFNSIRSAHHPASKALLNACDRLGMLVMDELSDVWTYHKNPHDFALYFSDYWEQELERMVAKDYNHPSVILYSAGNEIPEIALDTGARMKRHICNKFHDLDPTRYTIDGMNGSMSITYGCGMDVLAADMFPDSLQDLQGANALNAMMSLSRENADKFARHPFVTESLEESTGASDITGLNYLTGRYMLEKELHPNKTLIGTETYPPDIVRSWGLVKQNSFIIGDFTWAGYDYLGEAGLGIFHYDGKQNFSSYYPERTAYVGDLDLIGIRHPISYFREIVFGIRKEPYIAVERLNRYGMDCNKTAWMFKDNIESWTWPGYEGKPAAVDVYADADEVELFLNGKSLGRKPVGEAYHFTANYQLNYMPGELLAISYIDGIQTDQYKICTANPQIKLEAEADRQRLRANEQDLSFILIRLADEFGITNRYVSKKVCVRVEGEGVLQGFGNADPQSIGSYDETEWETFDGYAMAVIRAGNRPGKIKVSFTADNCKMTQVELDVTE